MKGHKGFQVKIIEKTLQMTKFCLALTSEEPTGGICVLVLRNSSCLSYNFLKNVQQLDISPQCITPNYC